jgi:pyridoxamine 5'-phosphate oxidase
MDKATVMHKLALLIEDSKTGILATASQSGLPHLRWMTPAILKDRPYNIFCVACPDSQKADDLNDNPDVQWMIQNRVLTEIVTLSGKVNIIDNPAIKSEVIEAIGHRLEVFWKANCDKRLFVVLETVIEEAVYFKPMQGLRETVRFEGGR